MIGLRGVGRWGIIVGCAVFACSGKSKNATWSNPPDAAAGGGAGGEAPTPPAAGAAGDVNASAGNGGEGTAIAGGGEAGEGGGTARDGDGGAGGAAVDPCAACAPTQHCVDGECRDPLCEPGARRCQDDAIYACRADGSGEDVKKRCSIYQFCATDTATCVNKQCEPYAITCDGTRVKTCDYLGSSWQVSLDCAEQGQGCLDGACAPYICEPGTKRCQGRNTVTCEANGLEETVSGYCVGDWHCVPPRSASEDFYCAHDSSSCEPNAQFCVDNTAVTCNPSGTDHLPGAINCGSDACIAGECKPVVCPGFRECRGSTIVTCTEKGTQFVPVRDCDGDERCVRTYAEVTCLSDACAPNQPACVANRLGTCAANGDALAEVTKDCAADWMVCTAAGSCAVQTSDTFGAGDSLRGGKHGTLIGNVVHTSSARLLIELEANLALPAERTVEFVVFEVRYGDQLAPMPLLSHSVQAPAGSGWISTGLIDVTLLADRSYLLGVIVSGGSFEARDDQAPWNGDASFGRAAGSVQMAAPVTTADIQGKRIFALRTSTELP